MLSQLASLSALAEQTASAFPDLDDPNDLEGEVGDRTVMRPDMLPPAGLGEDSPAASGAGSTKNGGKSSGEDDDEIEIDGDATVLWPHPICPAKGPSQNRSAPDRRPAAVIITGLTAGPRL